MYLMGRRGSEGFVGLGETSQRNKGSGGVEMGRRGAGREAAARWGRRAGGGATASVRRAPGSRVCALIYICGRGRESSASGWGGGVGADYLIGE